jgi:membrane fusion protein (multidrug efflux system)
MIGGAIALVAILAFAAHLMIGGAGKVHTDNAYIRADISVLSAEVQGYVRAVRVKDNAQVKAGDPLVEIDPSDYEARVAFAKANLARAEAQLAAGNAERQRASADYGRYGKLAHQGIFSSSGMDAIRAAARQADATTAAAYADMQAAKADLETAELNLKRTIIRAPVDGVIGNRVVQPGQLVRPGVQLLSVVPLRDVYIVANFKETQITKMRAGQEVAIKVDAYPHLKLTGAVDSFSPASGSQFSLLPQDTATGNFTKITQRVPVKIKIDMTPEAQGLLRPGLSVVATVDTKSAAR